MNLDRNFISNKFMCELCQLRRVGRARARAIRKFQRTGKRVGQSKSKQRGSEK
jgi:hypothetical protein